MTENQYPSEPLELNDDNFEEIVKRYPLVVVDFWAVWCPPCTLIAPVIHELARELSGRVVFGKIDVSRYKLTASKFGIMAIPTLLIFKKGNLVDRITGAFPKESILEKIKKYME